MSHSFFTNHNTYKPQKIDFVELDTLCTTGDPIGDNITQITLPSPQDNRGLAVQVNPTNFWNLGRISHKLKGILTPYVYNSTACFGTRVYVVDTGIWLTHAEFGGRAIWGANFIMGSPVRFLIFMFNLKVSKSGEEIGLIYYK